MIVGIGIDIEKEIRIQESLIRAPLFSKYLRDESGDMHNSNFVIREAIFKALGGPVDLYTEDILIDRTMSRPSIKFCGMILEKWPNLRCHLSLTRFNGVIIASVILEN
jgi:phosphopantetheinyl transferase (holo-ACP synthase)